MRIMGLDLGNSTLGVAISDPSEFLATGYPTIRFKSRDFNTALNELLKIIDQNNVQKIVLGLPKNMDGTLGGQALVSQNFKSMIEAARPIEVVLFDERLTTRVALNSMIRGNENRKTRHDSIDEMAAKIILQDYLDSKRR